MKNPRDCYDDESLNDEESERTVRKVNSISFEAPRFEEKQQ
jgi:hypothetical protein